MLSKLKFLLRISLCCIVCMNVVYGKNIEQIEDLLDDSISAEDKVVYLENIRGVHSFSSKDIDIILQFLERNILWIIDTSGKNIFGTKNGVEEGDEWRQKARPTSKDIKNINDIRISILKIFAGDYIDEDSLTQMQIGKIAVLTYQAFLYGDFDKSFSKKYLSSKVLIYLSLEVLIKCNRLKANEWDESDEFWNEKMIGMSMEDFAHVTAPVIGVSADALLEMSDHNKKKGWGLRSGVEELIFEPILLHDKRNIYRNESKNTLYNYEKHLLDNIKFFPITETLQKRVKRAFFKTQFIEFKSKYIDSMFYLDMRDALLKIISDSSIDVNLREQAIENSIKLLDQVDSLHFKKYSGSLLKEMNDIFSNSDENEELKNKVKEKIKYVQSVINEYDEVKCLENIIFSMNISNEEKYKYVDELFKSGFVFPKKDLGFIKRVFNNNSIDVKIKAKISYIGLIRSKKEDLLEEVGIDTVESMIFLFHEFHSICFVKSDDEIYVYTNYDDILAIYVGEYTNEATLKKYNFFDLWPSLIKCIENKEETFNIRFEAIKTSLDLLTRTKYSNEFSKAFLNTLQKILNDDKESQELKNTADYILLTIQSEGIVLKETIIDEKFKKVFEVLLKRIQADIELKEMNLVKLAELKDPESVIFREDLSNREKLEYLNKLFEQDFSFSKKDWGFIRKVLNSEDLKSEIVRNILAIVILRSDVDSLEEEFTLDDIKYMGFLAFYSAREIRSQNKYKISENSLFQKKYDMLCKATLDSRQFLRYYYIRDKMDALCVFLDDLIDVDIALRKEAIKTGLAILAKDKKIVQDGNYERMFLKKLRTLLKNEQESEDMKIIYRYILKSVKKGTLSLKNWNLDCRLKFLFGI